MAAAKTTTTKTSDRKFGPERRLKKRRDFLQLQSSGRKLRSEHFLLIYQDEPSGKQRLGITITKKVDKRATARNLLKRRIREFYRKKRPIMSSCMTTIIIAQEGACTLSYRLIARELGYLLGRAKILPPQQMLRQTTKE
ncbi:ribonuclease P protein component [bacterium]|nr:ribonuclease P protein component [bacterium]